MPELNVLRERLLSALDRQLASMAQLAVLAGIEPALLAALAENGAAPGWSAACSYRLKQALDGMDERLAERHNGVPDAFARRLAGKLHDGQLVLFAGAGLSHLCPPVTEQGARLPLWRGLAEQVACAFADEAVLPDDFNALPDFFDYLKALPQGQARIELALRSALDDRQVLLSPAHHELGRLPWSEIWTTNYDTLLERAAHRVTVDGEREFFHIREHERSRVAFVLHLHGTLHNPHTLSTLDYRGWEQANPKLLAYLRERLLNRTILFAGYGLGDPNLEQVLSWLRAVTAGSQVQMFGLFWHMAQVRLRQLELRDRIEAVSLTREEQWQMAFAQIAGQLRALQAPPREDVLHVLPDSDTKRAPVPGIQPELRGALLRALQDADENVRRAAVQALHHLAGQWGLIEQLLGALADRDADVRGGAADALRDVARHAAHARPLAAASERESLAAAREALRLLAANGAAMAVLFGALGDGQVRGALAQALREAACLADVRTGLLAVMQDPQTSAALRCAAMSALCICERELRLGTLERNAQGGATIDLH